MTVTARPATTRRRAASPRPTAARRLRRAGRTDHRPRPTTRTPTAVEQERAGLRRCDAARGDHHRRGRPRRRRGRAGPGAHRRARASSSSRARSPTPRWSTGSARRSTRSSPPSAPPADRPSDHFAKAGANDRIWNALEKLAVRDPDAFVDYYGNDILALVVDRLARPRLPDDLAGQRRPPGRHGAGPAPRLPPGLPVQRGRRPLPRPRAPALAGADPAGRGGALRHAGRVSGPTMYLPYSHQYAPGYLAWRLPGVPRVLRRRATSSCRWPRATPLLQPGAVPRRRYQRVGRRAADGEPAAGVLGLRSGDGDRRPGPRCRRAIYPVLQARRRRRRRPRTRCVNALACAAEGYPFPTNLDLDAERRRAHPARAGPDRPAGARRGLEPTSGWTGSWTRTTSRHRTDEIGQGEI